MNTDYWERKIVAVFEGEMTEAEAQALKNSISDKADLRKIWQDYEMLYIGLGSIEDEIPDLKVRRKFEHWLSNEIDANSAQAKTIDDGQKTVRKLSFRWQTIAGIAAMIIVILGFWQLNSNNQDISDSVARLEAKLDVQSPTERIKAIRVDFDASDQSADDKMINVLINVLNNDQSSNVRLATVETLKTFINSELVKTAFIKALTNEDDGAVKIAIIESLGKDQNQEVKNTLEDIVNDDSQEKFVIDEAHLQLIKLDGEEF